MRIKCDECGQKYKLAKQIEDKVALKCLECGSVMILSHTSSVSTLVQPPQSRISLTGEPLEEIVHSPPAPEIRFKSDGSLLLETDLLPPAAITKDNSSYTSAFVFLSMSGLMVMFQYFAPYLQAYTDIYFIVRNLSIVVAWLIIIYLATQDAISRGLLCVVFPPYLMLYVTGQVDSGWVRGLFFALLLGICAEAYLLPEASLILSIGPAVNGFIERVNDWIHLVSRPPV